MTERKTFRSVVAGCPSDEERAFALTLFYTGCRLSEALEITRNRIDAEAGSIVFRTLKCRDQHRFRIVPIPDGLVELLCEIMPDKRKTSAPIWPFCRVTGYRIIRRYMDEAGVVGAMAMPKGLRHSFAVACITSGVPITMVKAWMGHTSLETTAIYLNIMGEEEREQARKFWNSG